MELSQKITRSEFEFDLQTTPVVEKINVVKVVTETFNDKGEITDTYTRYQITSNFPFYLSVDCEANQLQSIIDAVEYVKTNTP